MTDDLAREETTIGPYILGAHRKGVTLEQINAMPPKQKSTTYQNIQTINIHMAALSDSFDDETSGSIALKLNGQPITIDKVVELGRALPDRDKLELIKKVMNENVTYTPPELDPFVTRRKSAPMKEIGDYAQTTRETFESGIGDCEDWAIAQTDLLAKMGIPPENLQIMSGTVYNSKDNTEFDHANLAVKTSDGVWNVMELGNGKVFVAPPNYLDDGMQGYNFIPNISIGGNGIVSDFKVNANKPSPTSKQGFTSSSPDYGLDNSQKTTLTSETAFNRASSLITSGSEQGIEITKPDLKQKVASNATSYLSTANSLA